ncbi:lipase family protein [Streptomyces sp. ODS28]|uniref:lipase family protein n=1 Tax=Streptomyces sp. ODS28 TaxID=3136688 RepID=UPI0031EBFFB1
MARTRSRGRRGVVAAVAAALLGTGLGVTAATAGAEEDPGTSAGGAGCRASDGEIYSPPAQAPGTPGQIIACRETKLPHVPGGIPMTAWKIQYASRDNRGEPVAVSGTVAVPKKAWKGPGSRPVVAFNPGTLGLGPQCAFSKQLAGQYQDEYEGDNIAASLKAGYAVAATDGAGYLDGRTHPYVSGGDSGRALLDVARAAPRVPGSGLDKGAEVGLWGYSEGGHASLWAAQLAGTYAPELNVAGDASGGVPGDLKVVAKSLNGGPFAGFLGNALVGLKTAYPGMPFDALLNERGRRAQKKITSHCLVGTLANFPMERVENLTKEGYSLDELYRLRGEDGTTWGEVVDRQKLGVGVGPKGSGAHHELDFPVFQYRGFADEVIPTKTEDATRAAYCKSGVPTKWKVYPGEHLTTDREAVDDVVKWLGERFTGKPATSDC